MLRNAPLPVLLTSAYAAFCLIALLVDATRNYAAVMLFALPVLIFWAGYSFFAFGKNIAKKLKDDEFGYGG